MKQAYQITKSTWFRLITSIFEVAGSRRNPGYLWNSEDGRRRVDRRPRDSPPASSKDEHEEMSSIEDVSEEEYCIIFAE
jgi:hypothetical protein